MSVASYLAAITALIVVIAGVVSCGVALQRLTVPDWDRTLGASAVAVGSVTVLILLAEILGTAHQLRRTPLVAAAGILGVIAWRVRPPKLSPPAAGGSGRGEVTAIGAIALACVAVVAAHVLVAVHTTGQTGVLYIDSVEYHLMFAAHFATSGSTTSVIHVATGDSTSYYPLNDELLHGVGMVLFHRDTLSLLLTGADLSLAILAAHALGAEFGRGALAVCAVTPLMAIVGIEDASAPNDWAALWPMLAAAAFVVRIGRSADSRRVRSFAIVGLAVGLCCGTKVNLLGPSAALAVGAVMIARDRRPANAAALVATAVATGGYWYVRDTVLVGSPIPGVRLPGLPRIPMSVAQAQGFSVAHYLANGRFWRVYGVSGLRLFFGDAWPAVVAVAAAGAVVALVRGRPSVVRVLGGVAIADAAIYLVTPFSAFGPPGNPYDFWVNLRYALPAVALGFLLAAVVVTSARWRVALAVAFSGLLAAVSFSTFSWSATQVRSPAVAVAVCVITAATLAQPAVRRHLRPIAAVGLAAIMVASYPLQQRYLHDRYRSTATPLEVLVGRLARSQDLRIGVGGRPAQFPFLGPTFANSVTYLGHQLPNHAFEDFRSCRSWRVAVAAGRYDVVVIENNGGVAPRVDRWTAGDPAATLLLRNSAGSIYSVGTRFAAAPCDGPTGS